MIFQQDILRCSSRRLHSRRIPHTDAAVRGYVNTNGDWPTARINFPIIRFAEMLLFRAEAYLMTGVADKATDDLNRIRLRSN